MTLDPTANADTNAEASENAARARRPHRGRLMPRKVKWQSNGEHYSANESLLGERVILRWGDHKGSIAKEQVGVLKLIRAATRGNTTLALTWTVIRESDGKRVKRDLPIWTLREHPFTIEPVQESADSEPKETP